MGLKNDVAFVAVALLLAYGIYQTVGLALGTQVPVVAVTSGSMEPNLHRGDMIVVEGEPFDRIKESDIVVFNAQHQGVSCMSVPIIHRVIDRDKNSISTKGDANPGQNKACFYGDRCKVVSSTTDSCGQDGQLINIEENITADQVQGTALFSIPSIGQIKLIPTCIYLNIVRGPDQVNPNVCPF